MKKRKVLIVGDHPLVKSLIRQYEALRCEVIHRPEHEIGDIDVTEVEELFLLPECPVTPLSSSSALSTLFHLLSHQLEKQHQPRQKIPCHLMVKSQQTLQILQTYDSDDNIRQYFDIYPFTMDETWSQTIELDYEPITLQSEKHVHLVVFGMSEMGFMVAIHAAHVAHYPNYLRDHSLRTRITFVDEQAEAKSRQFIQRYPHLFDNSYYRIVKPSAPQAVSLFHSPMYEGEREDFVDVEWEFVEASAYEQHLRTKLQLWGSDEKQLLTVVMSADDQERNLSEALHLPPILHQNKIPVFLYTYTGINLKQYPNIHSFGVLDQGYDVTLPYVRMAKNVNYIYHRCYAQTTNLPNDQIRSVVEIDPEERERLWQQATALQRMSSIHNAQTIPVKMRSVGLERDDWEQFYDLSRQDLELLAQVEHNRWCADALILGWRPCTTEEQAVVENDIEKKEALKKQKIHYDLRAYHDLREDRTGKSVKIYDLCLTACLPLIAKTFTDESSFGNADALGNAPEKGGER